MSSSAVLSPGVCAGIGMGMASQLVFALDGAGLTGQVAVVTDGQLSGLVNKGIVVGEVSPEAVEVGWLSVYQRLVRPLPEGAVLRPKEATS